jgi:hypothetical protein
MKGTVLFGLLDSCDWNLKMIAATTDIIKPEYFVFAYLSFVLIVYAHRIALAL